MNAQELITDMFLDCMVDAGNGRRGWGQYLDPSRDSSQFGIFGTSAGLQTLVGNETPRDHETVQRAKALLESITEVDGRFRRKGDFDDVYKLCYIIEALMLCAPDEVNMDHPVVTRLLEFHIAGQGMGQYYVSPDNRDARPSVTATAHALLALRGLQPFKIHPTCLSAVNWLAQRVVKDNRLRPHDVALSCLALMSYKSTGTDCLEYGNALRICRTKLIDIAKNRKAADFGDATIHLYRTPRGGEMAERFLFFLPDCLVCLALLQIGLPPTKVRGYILKVAKLVTDQTLTGRGFAPSVTGNVSTVDHLWLHRFLREFTRVGGRDLLPSPVLSTFGQTTLAVAFMAIGVAGYLYSRASFDTKAIPSLLQVIAGLMEVLGLGFAVNLISAVIGSKVQDEVAAK